VAEKRCFISLKKKVKVMHALFTQTAKDEQAGLPVMMVSFVCIYPG